MYSLKKSTCKKKLLQRLMLGGKYVTNLHVYLGFVHCQPGDYGTAKFTHF